MLKRFLLAFSILCALLVVSLAGACCAVAADAAPTSMQTIADTLQQTVFPVIGSLVLGLLSVLCTKIGQKFHIDSLTNKNNLLIQIATQGVAYAEEKAASLIGSKAQLTGSEKLDEAIAYICKALPKVSADDAQAAATAVLAMIPGVGATGNTAVAMGTAAAPASQVVNVVGSPPDATAAASIAATVASAPVLAPAS